MDKLTKGKVTGAIKAAMETSLRQGSDWVKVGVPGWENYSLRCRMGRLYRVQQHPAKMVSVRHDHTAMVVWSVNAGQVAPAVDAMMRRYEETGWSGPTGLDFIPNWNPE